MATPTTPARDAAAIFREVCIFGEGRFASGTIAEIDYNKLPGALRTHLEFPLMPGGPPIPIAFRRKGKDPAVRTSGQYFKAVESDTEALIAVEERVPSAGNSQRICSVASKSIEFEAMVAEFGGDALSSLRKEQPVLGRGRALAFRTNSSLGHAISIERLKGGYVLLQSSMASGSETPAAGKSIKSDGSK